MNGTKGKKIKKKTILEPRFVGEKFTGPLGAFFAAIVGGLLFSFAFAPYSLWALLPIALGFLFFSMFTRNWYTALASGFLWGMSAFIPLFSWANIYAGLEPWIALAAVEALYIAVFAVLARLVYVRGGLRLSSHLVVACLWASVEFVRAHYPWGGLSWALSAFAYDNSPLLNYGPWVGVVGLGVVSGLLGGYSFAVLMALIFRRRSGRNGVHAVWPAALIVLVLLGALVVPRPHETVPSTKQSIRVAGIQGNVEKPKAGSYYLPETMFSNHVAQTQSFIASGESADVIVWPEDSTGWDATNDPVRMSDVTSLSARANAPILIGTQKPVGRNQRLNTSVLIDAQGATGQEYSKRHPVPFGEYIPARSFFRKLTDKIDLVPTDMVPGKSVGIIKVGDVDLGVLICFEIAYDDSVRDSVMAGAQMLVVPSNTALFLDSNESVQQLSQAKVFAAISGRSVMLISTAGESAVYDPEGRELGSLGHWVPGTLVGDVPLRTTLTPGIHYAPYILVLTAMIAGIGFLISLVTPARKSEKDSSE